jgi:Tfp pilus assembly PilM family ATPase
MGSRNAIAIEIGRRRLRALLASRDRDRLTVRRVLVEDVPEQIDPEDASAVGAWIGERLGAADFPRGRATIAISREHVGLKRLTLPTVDDDELPEMTRLALQRELSFDAHQAVVDYVVVDRGETSTTVMAVAAPDAVVQSTREIIRAAGLGVERVALRATGSAALQRSAGTGDRDCVLVVDVSADGVEFSIIENGAIRFSRAAQIPHEAIADVAAGEADAEGHDPGIDAHVDEDTRAEAVMAEAIVTETRRSWMSYRIVEDASDVATVRVMGDVAVTALAAPRIGEMLGAETIPVTAHPLVTTGGERMDRVWPLAGLLLEPGLGHDTIDFARPHLPVNRNARLRRRGVIAAAVVLLVVAAFWTMGGRTLRGLAAEQASLSSQRARLAPDYARAFRDRFKLEHLRQWEQARVDWLDHALFIQQIMPPPGEAVIDTFVGSVDFRGVRFDPKAQREQWSAPLEVVVVLDGEARDRATADAIRDALVRNVSYTTSSSGADTEGGKRLPYGFTYRLESTAPGPVRADARAARGTGDGGDRP